MQRFTSNLFEPSHDQPVGYRRPDLTPHRLMDTAMRAHLATLDLKPRRKQHQRKLLRQVQSSYTVSSEPLTTIPQGQKLNGLASFRIHSTEIIFTSERFHGSGGKADVVQATFRRDNGSDEEMVAVKKIRSHEGTDQKKFSNEFVHEVEIMAGLSHMNIVRLVGFFEDLENGKAWVVLSWEPNGNVREFLATGKYEIPERVSLIKDVFDGIEYLHTRQPPICHGDLKSLNILVSSSYRAIITDFGSARAITDSEHISSNEKHDQQAQRNPTMEQAGPQIQVGAVGNQLTLTEPARSLRWAPPEVLDGEHPSLSTDIWAGGWICWEIMTDKVPFHEVNSAGAIAIMVIQGEVPETREDAQLAQIIRLCSLMKDCWAFDPKARPNIARCCADLKWIPSLPPSGGKASDSRVPSIELLIEMGHMHFGQDRPEKATSLFLEALALARSGGNQTATATALESLGDVYRFQSKHTQAEESYLSAEEIYAHVGDDWRRAYTLDGLGTVYSRQCKYTQAEEFFTRAQEIFARIGNDHGQANTLYGLGDVYRLQSKDTPAEESYTRAQEIFARIGDDLGQANALSGLGKLYRVQSKYTPSEGSFTRTEELYTRIGDGQGRAKTLLGLGHIYRLQSKYSHAEESYTRAQEVFARVGDDLGQANVLRGLGHLRQEQDRNAEAALLYTEAKYLYAQVGSIRDEENAALCLAVVSPKQDSSTL